MLARRRGSNNSSFATNPIEKGVSTVVRNRSTNNYPGTNEHDNMLIEDSK